MDPRKLRLGFLLAAGAIAFAFLLPTAPQSLPMMARPVIWEIIGVTGLLFLLAAWLADNRATAVGLVGAMLAAAASLALLNDPAVAGSAQAGFWMIVIASWLSVALGVVNLAAMRLLRRRTQRVANLLVPLLFGLTAFYLWEVAVRGFGVPPVLLPPPSAAAARFMGSLPTLAGDFTQTFIRGVLIGYAIGCSAGLLVAILAHRYEFLSRGLLPLGNFFSALPLVGVAPIMVMWFGFD
jgi:NitT/TauT family transport system permease protein